MLKYATQETSVHLVDRFYRTLESHKERCWLSEPRLTMTFYLCWYSVLFILKGAVISMMCFKSLLNIVFYSAPFLGGKHRFLLRSVLEEHRLIELHGSFLDRQPQRSREITSWFHRSHYWCDLNNRPEFVSSPHLRKGRRVLNAPPHISVALSLPSPPVPLFFWTL